MKQFTQKYSDFYLSMGVLLAGIFILFLHKWNVMSDLAWSILFVVSILLTGIPHGSLDHLVEKKHTELNGQRFQLTTFLLNYITRMAFYGVIWWISPNVGLILFFVISGWHFGETDLQYITGKNKILDWLMATTYGLFVLAVLLLLVIRPHVGLLLLTGGGLAYLITSETPFRTKLKKVFFLNKKKYKLNQ